MTTRTTTEIPRRADRARQVADVLRRQVLDGAYADTTVPLEGHLVDEFNASRNTIRAALDLLRAEGLVDRCPGVGTTVTSQKHRHTLDHLQGLAEVFDGRGTIRNEVRTVTSAGPPPAVRKALQLLPGEDAVFISRVRYLDEVPLSLDATYVTPDLGRHLLSRDLTTNDIFGLLEEIAGEPLGRADLVIEAVAADNHSAQALGTVPEAPLLLLERLTHLAGGRPVDFEFIRFRGDRLRLRGTTRRDPEEDR